MIGRGLASLALALAVSVGAASPGEAAWFPTPPPLPAPGALGGAGPCGRSEQVVVSGSLNVYIETPTGTSATPLVGGRCDSPRRPVIFFAHGFGVGTPDRYLALVQHWVSVGNIVVMADYDSAADLPTTFTQVDAGNQAAVAAEPRIDVLRTGFYGYSHGGGMVPYLAQQGHARGWGQRGLWLFSLSQAYTQWQGSGGPIALPAHARMLVVAGNNDSYADVRNGIDVFESVTIPDDRTAHVTLRSDYRGWPTLDATHMIVVEGTGGSAVDALDGAVWRMSDALQSCAMSGANCAADLTTIGRWSDGVPARPAVVTDQPVDAGPVPTILAECNNTVFALLLNPRIGECGRTRL